MKLKQGLGEKILQAVSPVLDDVQHHGDARLLVWSATAQEQLEAVVVEHLCGKANVPETLVARLFSEAQLGEAYWEESIELCQTRPDRKKLAKRIQKLALKAGLLT